MASFYILYYFLTDGYWIKRVLMIVLFFLHMPQRPWTLPPPSVVASAMDQVAELSFGQATRLPGGLQLSPIPSGLGPGCCGWRLRLTYVMIYISDTWEWRH